MRGKTHGYPVRLGLLAPFGGITRIRFKGFVKDVSANSGSPALRRRILRRVTSDK